MYDILGHKYTDLKKPIKMIVAIHPTQMYKSFANGSRISCTAILKACMSCCEKKKTNGVLQVKGCNLQSCDAKQPPALFS